MSIYQLINDFKANPPRTEEAARKFLANASELEAQQLIAALYIGREHIHNQRLRSDMSISRSYTDHISPDEYARILYEKGDNVIAYFDKLLSCAKASEFDLETL